MIEGESKTIRKDKLKNKAKVVREAIKDPLATQDQIAERAWVWKWTVNRNMQELDQNGLEGDIMDRILGMDDRIIDLANQITLRQIENKLENWKELSLIDTKIIWDLANNSTKRKAIFWGKEWKAPTEVIIQL